jgi:hypothetical protein
VHIKSIDVRQWILRYAEDIDKRNSNSQIKLRVEKEFGLNLRPEQTCFSYDINDTLDVAVQMWSKQVKELYE